MFELAKATLNPVVRNSSQLYRSSKMFKTISDRCKSSLARTTRCTKFPVVLALVATPSVSSSMQAWADEITLDTPMQALSLHEGEIDMVVYFLSRPDHFEVVATYASRDDMANPGRFRMGLKDGDAVRFSAPELPHTLYAFERNGDEVTVTASPVNPRKRKQKIQNFIPVAKN